MQNDGEETTMSDSVQERVGTLEQKLHTVQHQVGRLEEWPPRVTDLERTVQDLNVNMIHLQKSQQETRDEMRVGFDSMGNELKAGFKELRAASNVAHGQKSGLASGLRVALAVLAIGSAGAGAAIWYFDQLPAVVPGALDINGVNAICDDGTLSTEEGRGTCSGHGGVSRWLPD